MLYFTFVNPYFVYSFFVFVTVFLIRVTFLKREWIIRHKRTIFTIVTILLLWTQFVRYDELIFGLSTFSIGGYLPFYVCRVSAVVLLYYVITKDKRVESFLFYWGSLGLAGVVYPNGPIENIKQLTEVFYIDHVLLTVTPFFLVSIQGYKPNLKGLVSIVLVMTIMLFAFIPLNQYWGTDYFYLSDQSIFGIIFPNQPAYLFILAHSFAATIFFYGYYIVFKNYELEVCG